MAWPCWAVCVAPPGGWPGGAGGAAGACPSAGAPGTATPESPFSSAFSRAKAIGTLVSISTWYVTGSGCMLMLKVGWVVFLPACGIGLSWASPVAVGAVALAVVRAAAPGALVALLAVVLVAVALVAVAVVGGAGAVPAAGVAACPAAVGRRFDWTTLMCACC